MFHKIFYFIYLFWIGLASWSDPLTLVRTDGSLATAYDIYTDPSTGLRHAIFVSGDFSVLHYWQIDNENKVLLKIDFGDPKMFAVGFSRIVGAGDGKSLYVVIGAFRKGEKQLRDKWYTESQDGGKTWTPLIRVPREDMNDDFERDDARIILIQNSKRVFIFYTRYKGLALFGSISMVTKPHGSSVFSKEQDIYRGGITRSPELSSEYTLENGQPVLHVFLSVYSPETSFVYLNSTNNGIDWSFPIQINNTQGLDHVPMLETVSDSKITQIVAGLFKTRSKALKLFFKKGNGDFKVIPGSNRQVQWVGHFNDYADMAICGEDKNRMLFLLFDEATDDGGFNFAVWDLDKMTYKVEKVPYELNYVTSGVRLSCYMNQDKKIILSALHGIVKDNNGYVLLSTGIYPF